MAVCAGDEGERQRLQIHCAPLCDTAHRVRIRKSWANAPIAPQEKILYVPQPDYSSQLMITELMLAKYCGAYLPSVPKPLVQTLAHIGKYYTPKFIEKAVRMTCTPRRLQRLARDGTTHDDPAFAQSGKVKGVQGLTKFEHDEIGDVHHVVDRSLSHGTQTVL